MVIWPVALVTIVTQYIIMRMQHGGVLYTVWHPGSKQRDREGPGSQHPSMAHPLW